MKKTLVYGLATAAVLTSLGACRSPFSSVEALYGPPPEVGEQQDLEVVETLYGPPPEAPSADDIDKPIEDVYGPAPYFEDEEAASQDFESSETDAAIAGLYGPAPEG